MDKKSKIEDTLQMIKMALDRGNIKLLSMLNVDLHLKIENYIKNYGKEDKKD